MLRQGRNLPAVCSLQGGAQRILRRQFQARPNHPCSQHPQQHSHALARECRLFSSIETPDPAVVIPPASKDDADAPKSIRPLLPRDSLWRVVEMARPEWKWIAMSTATLGVTSSVTLLLPYASGQVIDFSLSPDGGMSPMIMAGGLFGLTAVSGTGVYLRSLWLARAGNRIVARLKQQLYASLITQEAAYLETHTTGDLLSRLSADAQLVESAVTAKAVSALRGLIMSVGSASMLLYSSPTLAAISLCSLPPIFIMSRHVGQQLREQQEQVQQLQGEANSLAEQSLSGIATVQSFVAEDYEVHQYRNAIAKAHAKDVETAHMQAQLESVSYIAANGAVLMVLGYGGDLVLQGTMTAGDLAGFVMYSLLMAGNLSSLSSLYGDLSRAAAASNRVFDVLDRKPMIPAAPTHLDTKTHDPLVPLTFRPQLATTKGTRMPPLEILIRNLDFSYPSRPDIPVLKNMNLSVASGEVLAVVGGSGSGKSTLANLITRLYEGPKHSIFINNTDIRDYPPHELRKMIGVVSQEPLLFRGSIADNIRYGEWDATDEDVLEAARLAHVLDFANGLGGMDAMVGPTQLSGGQKQRIAIARTLVKNPPLVIFDEATSALDAQSESLVQQAMHSIKEGRTVLSIAHRLSTIRHCDRIAVLQNGNVVQTGTFDDLKSKHGPFLDLMKTQLVGDVTV
jgi:ABC-type multidrug transport system fused ATPase/permease subunit